MKPKKIEVKVGDVHNLREALEDIVGEISQSMGMSEEKTPIGTISESLRTRYVHWQHEKEDMEAEINYKTEQLRKKMERELSALYEIPYNTIMKQKNDLWSEIEKELGITEENAPLTIDTATGLVSRKGKAPKSVAEGILN